MTHLSRRQWVKLSGAYALSRASVLRAGNKRLSDSPLVSVQDFSQYPRILTPNADYYVRNHFELPAAAADWRIQVKGAVQREMTWTAESLSARGLPTLTAVMECAGNGVGVGGVGCAEWKGPRLSDVIASRDLRPGARFVRFTGADRGRQPDAQTEIEFSRVLPIETAMSSAVLLALKMNGASVPLEHGMPVRLLVAGSYGMNSVKWLRTIEFLEEPGDDFFMAHRFRRVSNGTVGDPVGEMRVKSIIVQPKNNGALRGTAIAVGGYAWAGSDLIARVEVSLDGGQWKLAALLNAPQEYSWTSWKFDSGPVRAGTHSISVRAFTVQGQSQPERRDERREDGYELNQYHRIRCTIRP